jgi:hypothetical protein
MCTKFWLKNSEGKNPLRRPTHGWENNIKIDLRETGFGM